MAKKPPPKTPENRLPAPVQSAFPGNAEHQLGPGQSKGQSLEQGQSPRDRRAPCGPPPARPGAIQRQSLEQGQSPRDRRAPARPGAILGQSLDQRPARDQAPLLSQVPPKPPSRRKTPANGTQPELRRPPVRPGLPQTPSAATRYLFHTRPAGRLTCLFQGPIPLRGRGAHDRIAPYLPAEELRNDGRQPIWGLTLILAGAVTIRDHHTNETARLTAGSWFQFLDRPAQSITLSNPTPDFQEAAISCDRHTGTALATTGLWRRTPWHAHAPPDPALIAACLDLHRALLHLHIGTTGLLRRLAHVLELAYANDDADGESAGDAEGDHGDPGGAGDHPDDGPWSAASPVAPWSGATQAPRTGDRRWHSARGNFSVSPFKNTDDHTEAPPTPPSPNSITGHVQSHAARDAAGNPASHFAENVAENITDHPTSPARPDSHPASRASARTTFRKQACRLLSAHPEPAYAITDAARQLGLGVENFRKKFKKMMGIPPGTWHMQRRIERASALLASLSVVETARELGYPDAFAFSRQFKRVTGVSPKMLRR